MIIFISKKNNCLIKNIFFLIYIANKKKEDKLLRFQIKYFIYYVYNFKINDAKPKNS